MKRILMSLMFVGVLFAVPVHAKNKKDSSSQPGLIRTVEHDGIAVGKTVAHGSVVLAKQLKRIFY